MNRYGVTWAERHLGGHISLGNHRVLLYGYNAMHFALNIRTKWGWICFKPPTYCYKRWWPWYFYISPDGTPRSSTFGLGKYARRAMREKSQ